MRRSTTARLLQRPIQLSLRLRRPVFLRRLAQLERKLRHFRHTVRMNDAADPQLRRTRLFGRRHVKEHIALVVLREAVVLRRVLKIGGRPYVLSTRSLYEILASTMPHSGVWFYPDRERRFTIPSKKLDAVCRAPQREP